MTRHRMGPAICVMALGSLLGGCDKPAPPPADHPQLAAGAAMRDVSFLSKALHREVSYRVLLPAKLTAGQELPVVYLLHGNGGRFQDWSNYSDVSRYAAQGIILVMPDGNSSYFMNAVGRPEDRYEDYLTQDLIADVESRFPARKGREGRAIVGVSMGGFAAVKLALSDPGLYVFAAAISPAIDVPDRRFTWRRSSQWWRFRAIFGPVDSSERKSRDPVALVPIADPRITPFLYLTAGEQEALLEPNRRFAERLRQHGFAYEFHTLPGGHDWVQWDKQIPGCFQSLLKTISITGNSSIPAAVSLPPSGALRH